MSTVIQVQFKDGSIGSFKSEVLAVGSRFVDPDYGKEGWVVSVTALT